MMHTTSTQQLMINSLEPPRSAPHLKHNKYPENDERSGSPRAQMPKTRSTLSLRRPLMRNGRSTTFPISDQSIKSCANLEDMRNSIVNLRNTGTKKGVKRTISSQALRAISRTTGMTSSNKDKELEQDDTFFSMICFNPSDPQERSQYDDTAVKKYIRRHPEALKVTYDFQVGGRGRLTVARYPLYALVALGASLSAIKLAIKANPAALETTNDFNSTVLHAACSVLKIDMDVVRYIYSKYPQAIGKTTKLVYLPLHNACQTAAPSLELIEFLVGEYPEGLMAITKLGDTPLRSARRNKAMPEEILRFLEKETSRVFGLEENSAIFDAVRERQSWGSISIAKEVLEADESATEDETDEDDLPRSESQNSIVSRCA